MPYLSRDGRLYLQHFLAHESYLFKFCSAKGLNEIPAHPSSFIVLCNGVESNFMARACELQSDSEFAYYVMPVTRMLPGIAWILSTTRAESSCIASAHGTGGQHCTGGCRHCGGPGSVTVAARHCGGPKYWGNSLSPSHFACELQVEEDMPVKPFRGQQCVATSLAPNLGLLRGARQVLHQKFDTSLQVKRYTYTATIHYIAGTGSTVA